MSAPTTTRERLFTAAAELTDPAARAAFLDAACAGDAALRAEIEELLRHDAEAGSFLAGGVAPERTVDDPSVSERPGTLIGPFKLMEQIGEGGFGLVFVAEQQEPVRRKVALKVVKPGMDSREVLARFAVERQALALMDHPNIARVFDGGSTESGRPYFVMELVRGVTITDYCDQNQLAPRDRLELFVSVCHAVQHAHQKGIIHRDIKPSNVLVTSHDGRPVPKVIDFGVAKAVGQQLTDRTVYTQFAQLIGTPLYMSPEQAEMSGLDVDTRSDIYSLGVLLYELLTGTTPFDRERLAKAGLDEIRRVIREEEPEKPSTRLSHSVKTLAAVASRRKTEPAKLSRLVRGDLDWITMKCLEKDRGRRYETANGLALDVQRYLTDQPVHAGRPSPLYRFRKFARRHKAGLAVAAALLACLVLTGAGAGWFLRDRSAQHAETAARIDAALQEAARLRDGKNWTAALVAAQRADALLGASDNHADFRRRHADIVRDLDMVAGLEQAGEELLSPKDDEWNFIAAEAGYDAAFRRYGIDVTTLDARVAAERVRASPIADQLVPALDQWRYTCRTDLDRAGRIRAVVCAADPDPFRLRLRDPEVRRNRAALEELAGRLEAAGQPPSVALELGRALNDRGAFDRAVAVMTAALRRHPDHLWLNMHLGSSLRWRCNPPRFEEATICWRTAVALRPNSPAIYIGLASCFLRRGREEEAVAYYRRALELNPDHAQSYLGMGNAFAIKGAWPEAIEAYNRCLARSNWPYLRARTCRDLGIAHFTAGDWGQAIVSWRKCVEIEPQDAYGQSSLAWCLANAPDPKLRDPAAAVAHAKKAAELSPRPARHWSYLGVACLRAGDARAAAEHLEKADSLVNGGDLSHRFFLAMAYWQLGDRDKAHMAFQQGAAWMDANRPGDDDLSRFRAEAEQAMK